MIICEDRSATRAYYQEKAVTAPEHNRFATLLTPSDFHDHFRDLLESLQP